MPCQLNGFVNPSFHPSLNSATECLWLDKLCDLWTSEVEGI